jgi:hypothetical protein
MTKAWCTAAEIQPAGPVISSVPMCKPAWSPAVALAFLLWLPLDSGCSGDNTGQGDDSGTAATTSDAAFGKGDVLNLASNDGEAESGSRSEVPDAGVGIGGADIGSGDAALDAAVDTGGADTGSGSEVPDVGIGTGGVGSGQIGSAEVPMIDVSLDYSPNEPADAAVLDMALGSEVPAEHGSVDSSSGQICSASSEQALFDNWSNDNVAVGVDERGMNRTFRLRGDWYVSRVLICVPEALINVGLSYSLTDSAGNEISSGKLATDCTRRLFYASSWCNATFHVEQVLSAGVYNIRTSQPAYCASMNYGAAPIGWGDLGYVEVDGCVELGW